MRPLDEKKKGLGAATPEPQAVDNLATAIGSYLASQSDCKGNEQWLALPRPLVELGIQIAIDWLDMIDRQAETAENVQ